MQLAGKYDLVFGIGAACSRTVSLRTSKLQLLSFPFDWLVGASLKDRANYLIDRGCEWLIPENLSYAFSETAIKTGAYYDKCTGITFNHDFPSGVSMMESHAMVKKKYERRFNRLHALIGSSKNALVVYLALPNDLSVVDSDAQYCQELLSRYFANVNIKVLLLRQLSCRVDESFVINPYANVFCSEFDYRQKGMMRQIGELMFK